MPAVKIAVNAMPASTTVRRDEPPRPATAKMSPATHNAPRKAATGASPKALGKAHAASSTKKPEPAFTPMTLGLARGLSSAAWMSAPACASAAPARSAASTRGRRMFQMTFAAVCSAGAPKARASTSGRPTEVEPMTMPSTAAHPSSATVATMATANRPSACKARPRLPREFVICISFKIRRYFCSHGVSYRASYSSSYASSQLSLGL